VTTPSRSENPAGADAREIWHVSVTAARRERPGTDIVVLSGGGATRVFLPTRKTARAAQAALAKVGYAVSRPSGIGAGRDLIVHGWDAELLDARLRAMAAVITTLASARDATAIQVLDQLSQYEPGMMPDRAGQAQLILQAGEQLRDWIVETSGLHAPHDPAIRPLDTGLSLRLSATREAEDAIGALFDSHTRLASHALVFYPALRRDTTHEQAASAAIRQAAELTGTRLPRRGFGRPGPDGPERGPGQVLPLRSPVAREFPSPGSPALPAGPRREIKPGPAPRPGTPGQRGPRP
jgi:hypothetical protein